MFRNFVTDSLARVAVLLLAIVAGFCFTASAKADETYLPLQDAHTGLYTDVNYLGEGLNVYTFEGASGREAFVLGYLGRFPGALDSTAPWVYAGGSFKGHSTTLTVCTTSAAVDVPRNGTYCTPIGKLTLTADDSNPDRLYAAWEIGTEFDPEYSCENVPAGFDCIDPENYPRPGYFVRVYDRLSNRLIEPYRCPSIAVSPPAPGC